MLIGNGSLWNLHIGFIPASIIPFVSVVIHLLFTYMSDQPSKLDMAFVHRYGPQFVVNGKPFYMNGWNSYWLMARSVDVNTRPIVQELLKQAADMGLTVCRTWAFNDGGYQALQLSPGKYDEKVFQALDFVVSEAKTYGIRLLLSLANNWDDYGGKTQYVKWAKEAGIDIGNQTNDAFYTENVIIDYYKAHVKAVLTRVNTITGIEYREEPGIFGWELMNEPRCTSDASGFVLQKWIDDMSSYLKSLDKKHLVTVGLEGFYGGISPKSIIADPNTYCQILGTDFNRNHLSPNIDFTTVHAYPDSWRSDTQFEDLLNWFALWVRTHTYDGALLLQKPVVFAEFGLADKFGLEKRLQLIESLYNVVYHSAMTGGAAAGAMIWQLMADDMVAWKDPYTIFPSKQPEVTQLIHHQSQRLQKLVGGSNVTWSLKFCPVPMFTLEQHIECIGLLVHDKETKLLLENTIRHLHKQC